MPSPFPGMDPYLEDPEVWPDFHVTFLASLRPELNKMLPPRYVARLDRYVRVDDSDAEELRLVGNPDAYVADQGEDRPPSPQVAAVAAPWTVTLPSAGGKGKPYMKIIDPRSRRVVTVIELLSPANKRAGKDRDAYLIKRREYLENQINLVEMDFLRTGLRAPVNESLPATEYLILVSSAADAPRAGVWPLTVRDTLPEIPVPLAGEDPPARLALQPCFNRAYDEARYEEEIDYDNPPVPTLTEPDATWARELLARRHP